MHGGMPSLHVESNALDSTSHEPDKDMLTANLQMADGAHIQHSVSITVHVTHHQQPMEPISAGNKQSCQMRPKRTLKYLFRDRKLNDDDEMQTRHHQSMLTVTTEVMTTTTLFHM
jgi:cell envelope opacity-associated protein A